MAKTDYYDLLGVARDADADTVKKAYRKLAMKYHPDRNPDDSSAEQKFKEINEAYDVLKDDQKRAAYDQFGHGAFDGAAGPRSSGFGTGFADIFDEMFGDFVGGRHTSQTNGRGADLRYNLEITIEDAFKGRETKVRVPTSVACETCAGSGAAKGSRPAACQTCQGRGRVRAQQGFFTVERTCPACHGAGQVIQDPCRSCSGTGRVHKEKMLAATIPPGVEDGTRIRLAGEGEAGFQGAAAGDLYIFLSIASHRLFQRHGADIHCHMPIPMTTAALGGTVEVPTVDGSRARVTIPSGTQSGHQFRLRGKGMPVLHSSRRGDMYIETAVETPVNLTKPQQDMLRDFENAAHGGTKPMNPQSEGFFAKVKELWEDLRD